MPRKEGLTAKEKAFCEEYVFNSKSANKAYLAAYDCKESTANSAGWKLLKKDNIREYITELQKQAFEAACISAEKVALKLSDIAFAEKDDKNYNATAQLKALDLLQKQLGVQTHNVNADINSDINININIEEE